MGGGELEPFSEAGKTRGRLGHVRGQGHRSHGSARTKGLATSGSALVQSKDAGLVQVLPQGGFQGEVVVDIEYQWFLYSLEIVVRKFPVVACDESIGTNLVTGVQSCQQHEGPSARHI